MKKFFLAVMMTVALFTVSTSYADELNITDRVLLYIPNRLMDALDMFTVNIGVGPVFEAKLQGTEAIKGGAGWGLACKLYKAHNRQYGVGIEDGWYWSFVNVGEESKKLDTSSFLVKKYVQMYAGFPNPNDRIFDFHKGARDYWAIGGTLGGLVIADVYIHPFEWADMALGLVLVDIKGDDYLFDDFR